jgi:hypothetical protein
MQASEKNRHRCEKLLAIEIIPTFHELCKPGQLLRRGYGELGFIFVVPLGVCLAVTDGRILLNGRGFIAADE